MKRPLWVVGVLILTSILVGFFMPFSVALSVSLLLSAVALVGIVVVKGKHRWSDAMAAFTLALGLVIGSGHYARQILPFQAHKGEQLYVEGIIVEVHQSSQRSTRYTLRVTFPDTNLPESDFIIRDYLDTQLRLGERISCNVTFDDSPHKSVNDLYLRRSIPGEGKFFNTPTILPNEPKDKGLIYLLRVREGIQNKVHAVLPEGSAKIVSTMVFGLKESLPSQLYTDFGRSGTVHVLSVSGMHLSTLTLFLLWMLRLLGVKEKLGTVLCIFMNIAFTLLVGLSAPVFRAAVMSVLFLLSRLVGRDNDSLNALGMAALIIAIIRPSWVLTPGLWLSFLSTAGIIVVGIKMADFFRKKINFRRKWKNLGINWIAASFSITMGAFLFTFPLLTMLTGYFSLISPVANLLINPFTSIIVVAGIAVTALPVITPFYPVLVWVVDFSVRALVSISAFLSSLPFATLSVDGVLGLTVFLAVTVAVIYTVVQKEKRLIVPLLLAAVTLTMTVGITNQVARENRVEIALIEGSDSTVIIRGENCIVVGTPDQYEVGELLAYLQYKQVKSIDCLMLYDHPKNVTSALSVLQNNIPIKSVIGPSDETLRHEIQRRLPGVTVLPYENAIVEGLGNVGVYFPPNSKSVNLLVGGQKAVITDGKYDIMNRNVIYIDRSEKDFSGSNLHYRQNPIGKIVFGEQCLVIMI